MDHRFSRANVVDLLRYRQHRPASTMRLPLTGRPALAPVSPFRPLSTRQLEHRMRMLKHCGG
jgi:hypothetical protein